MRFARTAFALTNSAIASGSEITVPSHMISPLSSTTQIVSICGPVDHPHSDRRIEVLGSLTHDTATPYRDILFHSSCPTSADPTPPPIIDQGADMAYNSRQHPDHRWRRHPPGPAHRRRREPRRNGAWHRIVLHHPSRLPGDASLVPLSWRAASCRSGIHRYLRSRHHPAPSHSRVSPLLMTGPDPASRRASLRARTTSLDAIIPFGR